jgi:hypothetical protein
VEEAASHIQRMQKALTQMNLMLHLVLSDITGATGLKIVRSILEGERDPVRLAAHRDRRCHASPSEIIAALTGNYRAEHLFTLKQNFAAYQFKLQQIAECDSAIQTLIDTLAAQQPPPATELPPARHAATPKRHAPRVDIRTSLHRLTGGADLSQIDGIGPPAALQLVGEIGTDMSRWPTDHHFASWLSLAPNNKISGGRLLSARTQPSANRAAAILRRWDEPHAHLHRTRRFLPAPGRAHRQAHGDYRHPAQTRPTGLPCLARRHPGAGAYAQLHRTHVIKALRKRAQQLGLTLFDSNTGQILTVNLVSPNPIS